MSAGVEKMRRDREQDATLDQFLQNFYEQKGGTGLVKDFIEIGATDPKDGVEKHWGTMTDEEQELWLSLVRIGFVNTNFLASTGKSWPY